MDQGPHSFDKLPSNVLHLIASYAIETNEERLLFSLVSKAWYEHREWDPNSPES